MQRPTCLELIIFKRKISPAATKHYHLVPQKLSIERNFIFVPLSINIMGEGAYMFLIHAYSLATKLLWYQESNCFKLEFSCQRASYSTPQSLLLHLLTFVVFHNEQNTLFLKLKILSINFHHLSGHCITIFNFMAFYFKVSYCHFPAFIFSIFFLILFVASCHLTWCRQFSWLFHQYSSCLWAAVAFKYYYEALQDSSPLSLVHQMSECLFLYILSFCLVVMLPSLELFFLIACGLELWLNQFLEMHQFNYCWLLAYCKRSTKLFHNMKAWLDNLKCAK